MHEEKKERKKQNKKKTQEIKEGKKHVKVFENVLHALYSYALMVWLGLMLKVI